jgi:hypothetical protein
MKGHCEIPVHAYTMKSHESQAQATELSSGRILNLTNVVPEYSREATDERYQALTVEGYVGRQEPTPCHLRPIRPSFATPERRCPSHDPIDQHRRFTPRPDPAVTRAPSRLRT